jgi:hypothetical protein
VTIDLAPGRRPRSAVASQSIPLAVTPADDIVGS